MTVHGIDRKRSMSACGEEIVVVDRRELGLELGNAATGM
jgi:hypothetical protein